MTKVAMTIPPARASQYAQLFEEQGFEVSWEAPFEKSTGVEAEVVHVVFWLKDNAAAGLVGGAAYAAAQGVVRRIRDRFPSVQAEVHEDDAEDS
jgi:hypothetical protein